MAVSLAIVITQNSQSIANNTSNVTVKVNASWTYGSFNKLGKSGWLTIDGTKYTFTSSFNTGQSTSGTQTLFTKTVDVTHNSNGAKTLTCSASYTTGVSSGTITASASKVLTTIPRKSSLSASNGTLGTAQTLTVSRMSSSFTHTITYSCGSASGTVCSKSSSTSISWTPPLSLASQNTTGTSVSIKFTITTYNGSTSVGSNTKSISCTIPSSVKPSCTVTVTDSTEYSATYGNPVKGLSKFKVVVTPTTSYGSPIASYRTTANGTTYTESTFTTGILISSGTLTVTANVTDKRGRSGSASVSKTVIEYSKPAIINLSVLRCNSDGAANDQGEYVKVSFKTLVTSLNNLNTASYTLKYKRSDAEEYTVVSLDKYKGVYSVTDGVYIFAADSGSSYDIEFSVTDAHYTTARATTASTGFVLMHFNNAGNAMGIGKTAEVQNALDVGMQTRFYGGILHPILEPETDLNEVRVPNTYVGANLSHYNYSNCPLSSGTFTLTVEGAGEDGQLKQRLTRCSKEEGRTWERWYYQAAWGNWVEITPFEVVLYDSSSGSAGTITLSETCANFKYLEIYFNDNNSKGDGYTKIYSPDSSTVYLSLIEPGNATTTYIRRTAYAISGKTITPNIEAAGYWRYSGSTHSHSCGTNYIKINRVVGRR